MAVWIGEIDFPTVVVVIDIPGLVHGSVILIGLRYLTAVGMD